MPTIGFIGLGHMGNPMARNLIKTGHTLKVYDVVPAAVKALTEQGATACKTIAEVTQGSDVVITMLQTGEQVRNTCLDKDGIFAHAGKNLVYIDSSSIDIATTQSLHKEAEARGISMVDSPVSGGVSGAEAATLTFMVGGSEKAFKQAQPILQAMGKKIVHAGIAGCGQAAKICNNLILGISMIGVSEGFILGKKLGLDPKKFFEISSSASGQCWSMTSYCPVPDVIEKAPSNQNYQPGFMAKMMLKDLRLAEHAAETTGTVIPMGAVASELYALFVGQGHGEMDFSGIIKMLEGE